MLRQRQPIYRSSKWLAAVRKIENCVLCGAYGVQAAHLNEGKGMGMKTDDALTAALCPACHHELDNGNKLSREERREILRKAVLDTIALLARRGLIEVKA
ncbi:DUF1364 family protein [Azotobacter salinestris]|uniref:DUF1364 family protein n=1 Tax=Azotobacter salinestris TaxID=69964 RepID=UPI001266DBE9|nr:DUF1364 family protein [Azotobacter salinestris]